MIGPGPPVETWPLFSETSSVVLCYRDICGMTLLALGKGRKSLSRHCFSSPRLDPLTRVPLGTRGEGWEPNMGQRYIDFCGLVWVGWTGATKRAKLLFCVRDNRGTETGTLK